jgi:23S rRNA U2552 (ribose-2'-O)-methylase RlmE/FtsJ
VDQAGAAYLTELALDFSQTWLKPNGNFLVKVFIGAGFDDIDWSIKSDPPTETTHHLKQYGDVSEAEMKEYIATGTIKKD